MILTRGDQEISTEMSFELGFEPSQAVLCAGQVPGWASSLLSGLNLASGLGWVEDAVSAVHTAGLLMQAPEELATVCKSYAVIRAL